MVSIQPMKKLCEGGNRSTGYKLRVKMIKDNIKDEYYLNNLFEELSNSLSLGSLDEVVGIVEKLFFEVIHSSFIIDLHRAYLSSKDKITFINNLKESYIIRGIKSAIFAWSPIIAR